MYKRVNEHVDLPSIEETNDKTLKEKLLEWYNEFRPTRRSVKNKGVNLYGKNIRISIRAFICDTPARSFLCNLVGHNSFNGCPKRYQKGTKIKIVTTYSSKISELRSFVENFSQISQKDYGITPNFSVYAFENNLQYFKIKYS